MRLLTKVLIGSTVAIGGGSVAFSYLSRPSPETQVKSLSAAEFNGLQNQQILREALKPGHLPWTYHQAKARYAELDRQLLGTEPVSPSSFQPAVNDYRILFYRLLGCPYCAKVEALLQFYDVPYKEVLVDPITGAGLPDRRYELAPQLYLTPVSPHTTESSPSSSSSSPYSNGGAFVVDSAAIVTALATPLGLTRDLANPRISTTRSWITQHFHGASLVITNSSYWNAYATYPYVTPAAYQNMLYHIIGSGALYLLARYKVQPKLMAAIEPSLGGTTTATKDMKQDHRDDIRPSLKNDSHSTGLEMLNAEELAAMKTAMGSGSPEVWLKAELSTFLHRRAAGKLFHGGDVPDLADIEMYGVTRVLNRHPHLGHVLEDGAFGEWQQKMRERLSSMTGGIIYS